MASGSCGAYEGDSLEKQWDPLWRAGKPSSGLLSLFWRFRELRRGSGLNCALERIDLAEAGRWAGECEAGVRKVPGEK